MPQFLELRTGLHVDEGLRVGCRPLRRRARTEVGGGHGGSWDIGNRVAAAGAGVCDATLVRARSQEKAVAPVTRRTVVRCAERSSGRDERYGCQRRAPPSERPEIPLADTMSS
ncbi:hypothetical protein GCM10027068_39310 [Prescottella soli]